jgi:hypothetical protein
MGPHKWIQNAIMHKGELRRKAYHAGLAPYDFAQKHIHDVNRTGKQSRLALTLKKINDHRHVKGTGLTHDTYQKILEDSYIDPNHRQSWSKAYAYLEDPNLPQKQKKKMTQSLLEDQDMGRASDRRSDINGYILQDLTEHPELDRLTTYGQIYYNPETNHVVVSHRGTKGNALGTTLASHNPNATLGSVYDEDENDWANNSIAFTKGENAYKETKRFKRADEIQRQAKAFAALNNAKLSTVGHSQGAYLAHLVGQESDEILGYNPMAVGSSFFEPAQNEYFVVHPNDIASTYAPKMTLRSQKSFQSEWIPKYNTDNSQKFFVIDPKTSKKSYRFDPSGAHMVQALGELEDVQREKNYYGKTSFGETKQENARLKHKPIKKSKLQKAMDLAKKAVNVPYHGLPTLSIM